jgi:hypothetical protein
MTESGKPHKPKEFRSEADFTLKDKDDYLGKTTCKEMGGVWVEGYKRTDGKFIHSYCRGVSEASSSNYWKKKMKEEDDFWKSEIVEEGWKKKMKEDDAFWESDIDEDEHATF